MTLALAALLCGGAQPALAEATSAGDGGVPARVDAALGQGLLDRKPFTDTAAAAGGWRLYTIRVPRHRARLSVTLDCAALCPDELDLYVRRESEPTVAEFRCRSVEAGSDEACRIQEPRRGTWHIGIHTVAGDGGSEFEITARVRR